MTERDDRLLPVTRVLGVIIIPFLFAASVLLVIFPSTTDLTFAWAIEPPVTAMLLGSAYVGGIWFFAGVVLETRWHRVAPGFPAVVVFATLLGIATLLHLDRFHAGHISFITWSVLYATTPVAVLVVWLVNRRHDPRRPEPGDAAVPRSWAVALAGIGGAASVTGLVMFITPELLMPAWGWELTPLTARVVGAVLTLPGIVNAQLLADRRWSSFRWVFQAQLASLAIMLLAVAVRAGDLEWERPGAAGFVVVIAISAVAYGAFYWRMARAARSGRRAPAVEAAPVE